MQPRRARRWTHAAGGTTTVRVDEASVLQRRLRGHGVGHVARDAERARARSTCTAQLTRAERRAARRAICRCQLSEPLRDWLTRALVKGQTNDVRLVLKGNLADFPFPDNRNGQFLVAIKAHDATLDYAEHWPPIQRRRRRRALRRLAAEHRRRRRGRVLGAALGRTRVEIADLRERPATVHVDGEAEGPTAEFLAFVNEEPGRRMDRPCRR